METAKSFEDDILLSPGRTQTQRRCIPLARTTALSHKYGFKNSALCKMYHRVFIFNQTAASSQCHTKMHCQVVCALLCHQCLTCIQLCLVAGSHCRPQQIYYSPPRLIVFSVSNNVPVTLTETQNTYILSQCTQSPFLFFHPPYITLNVCYWFCFFKMAFLGSPCLTPRRLWHFLVIGCCNLKGENKNGTEKGLTFGKGQS